jgi:phosphoglycolate phosphatase-like HAD superfamily hydrolase
MDDLRPVLGFEAWPVDLFRHTFATFHLARHQDAGRTAHQLGNSSDVVYRHYRALATSQQAKRFFSICPKPFIEERRAKRRRINDKNTSNTNASIIEST